MGKYLNIILVILILIIITVVSSTIFYKKGQEDSWEMAKQLVPLEKGEIFLCIEQTDANAFGRTILFQNGIDLRQAVVRVTY